MADRGYDSQEIICFIERHNAKVVIPQRRNSKQCGIYDRQMYKKRYKIECFFSKIKHFRRVATRYEKLADNYKTMVLLAFIMIWIRI